MDIINRICRIIFGLVLLPLLAFVILWALHKLTITLFQYGDSTGDMVSLVKWSLCTIIEKFGSLILCSVIAFTTFRFLKESIVIKWFISLIAPIVFQGILILHWIVIWGLDSYMQYNRLWQTLFTSVALAFIGGGIAQIVEKKKLRQEESY